MLDCKKDRLDYGELLRPPEGYRLDNAFTTTYSADLGTLLSIPVALVYAQTLEGDLSGARFQLLEGIKQFSGRVKVFHQKGKLHNPAKLNWLYAHLENALVPILLPDAFASFHPKLWVVRYTATDEIRAMPALFRVIVLSRNLTFDRSWDVAACIEGAPTAAPRRENQPLINFVQWLDAQTPSPTAWAREFIAGLATVKFTPPAPFSRIAFHPIGTPEAPANPVFARKASKALVISPFLHTDALAWLRANTGCLFLFSNRDELEHMPPTSLRGLACHHLSERVIDGEFQDGATEGALVPMQQNLHAKLFIFNESKGATWFLGSANATKAALTKNVEFMLELGGGTHATRVQSQLHTLIGDDKKNGAFVSYEPSSANTLDEASNARRQAIRRFEHALLQAPITGKATRSANGAGFDLSLALDLTAVPPIPDVKVTVQPFNIRAAPKPVTLHPGRHEAAIFANLSEVELSRFLLFSLALPEAPPQEFLLCIVIGGLPEDRLENILRKLIDSREKFFDYLRFLLADDIEKEDLLANDPLAHGTADEDSSDWHAALPIFEQLLVTASRSPKKLKDIDDIIRHLAAGESTDAGRVIPPDFIAFWAAFRSLIPAGSAKKNP